jgi:hypothetical protein
MVGREKRLRIGHDHLGADASAYTKLPSYHHPARANCSNQIIHDAVGHGFMESALFAITPEIQLQRFELYAQVSGYVLYDEGREVRLSR